MIKLILQPQKFEMENISETVLLCMISIVSIQFTIILTILKRGKKSEEEVISKEKILIEILNTSARTTAD